MKWYDPTSWFTEGAAKVIGSIGSIVDDLHTSDEEKLLIKVELQKQMDKMKELQLKSQAEFDKEITKRWTSDNEHTITRLVRPLSYVFVLSLFAFVVLLDGNAGGFKINPQYIPVIEGLLVTMTIAYFGSRGAEKITSNRNIK